MVTGIKRNLKEQENLKRIKIEHTISTHAWHINLNKDTV